MNHTTQRPRRFFSENPLQKKGDQITLSKEESHHLHAVIRLSEGDTCLVIDGKGHEAEAVILADSSKHAVTVQVQNLKFQSDSQNQVCVRAAVALSKNVKMEFLVEKAQELGVNEFWPLETHRSQVPVNRSNAKKWQQKWDRRAVGAMKQSGCLWQMKVMPVRSFSKVVEPLCSGDSVLFHPGTESQAYPIWFEQIRERVQKKECRDLTFFLGPEGGFDDSEVALFRQEAFEKHSVLSVVSLGDTILKLDTAFITVVSAMKLLT